MSNLIFDENCPYCRATAKTASALSDVKTLEYGSEDGQKILDKTFEDPGFTLYLFNDDRVYWGREATRIVAKKAFIPHMMFYPIVSLYTRLIKIFSVLSLRRGVRKPACGSDRCMKTEEGGGMKKLKKGRDLLEFTS